MNDLGQTLSSIGPADPVGTNVHSSGSSTTTSSGQLSPDQAVNFATAAGLASRQRENIQQQTEEDKRKAAILEQQARAEVQLQANTAFLKQKALGEQKALIDEARENWRNAVADHKTAVDEGSRDMWEDRGAAKQFFGALMIGLGTLGSGMMQAAGFGASRNHALDIITDAIHRDGLMKRQRIAAMNDRQLMARTGIQDAEAARREALADIDAQAAARWAHVKSFFSQRLAARGMNAAQIAGDARVIKAQQEENALEAKALEPQTIKISTTTTNRTEEKAETGKGPKPGAHDVDKTAELDEGIKNAKALLEQVEKHPEAWGEYKDNAESWKRRQPLRESGTGKILTAVDAMNVAPEQGLKTSEAKTLHQRQERLNTAIAKGFGGVITEGDRQAAASNQANLALTPQEKAAQLKEFIAGMESKRQAYTENRGVKPAGGSATAPGQPGKMSDADALEGMQLMLSLPPGDPKRAQIETTLRSNGYGGSR